MNTTSDAPLARNYIVSGAGGLAKVRGDVEGIAGNCHWQDSVCGWQPFGRLGSMASLSVSFYEGAYGLHHFRHQRQIII